jgi:glutathione S-transferase
LRAGLRLFAIPYSTNVERVALALAHKRLEAEVMLVPAGDRTEVQRVSGQDLVPVLEDDGTVIADSPAILQYLEARYPNPPLFPADSARRAEVDVFIDWFNLVWKGPPNEIDALLREPERDEQRIVVLAASMAESLDRFERMLSGRDYLMGDSFGAADCTAFPFLKYALLPPAADDPDTFHQVLSEYQQLGSEHSQLAAWIRRVDERPRG